jgi:hypothetical protein
MSLSLLKAGEPIGFWGATTVMPFIILPSLWLTGLMSIGSIFLSKFSI